MPIEEKEKGTSCEIPLFKAPLTDLLSNHLYEDLAKLYELKPYLNDVQLQTELQPTSRLYTATG